MNAPIPVLVDTDPALGVEVDDRPHDVDDAWALVQAANEPALALRGVTVVHGNAPLPLAAESARQLQRLGALTCPVTPGAAGPLHRAPDPAAADWLAASLRDAPARIAALGPLTNLGLLLERHPDVAGRIDEVVFVGGRSAGAVFEIGGRGPVGDFNFETDPEAARVLLEAGVPVTCAGFELSVQVSLERSHLDAVRAHGTPVARHLADGSVPWLEWWTEQFPGDRGFHPWDSAAIAWLAHPEWFEARSVSLAVRAGDGAPVLEATESPGDRGPHRLLTGFRRGGGRAFLDDVVARCR